MEVHYHPKARQAGKDNNKIEPMKKIISFMHISLDGFEAGPSRQPCLPAGRYREEK